MDTILEHGDTFFKSLGKDRFFGIEDLPGFVTAYDKSIKVNYNFNTHGILSSNKADRLTFESNILDNLQGNTGFLLWLSEICVSIILNLSGPRSKKKYLLFDSHSRDSCGRFSDNGKSVLLKFDNHINLVKYLYTTYVDSLGNNRIPYQIQFIKCKVVDDRESIIRRGKKKAFFCCYASKWLKEIKKSAHIAPLFEEKDSFANTNQAPDFVSIAKFLAKITEGPYFICVVCNRMLYRQSVLLVHKANYTRQDLVTTVKSFDSKQYACFTCHRKVKQGKIPCQAVRNKLELDEIPPELADLGKLEAI